MPVALAFIQCFAQTLKGDFIRVVQITHQRCRQLDIKKALGDHRRGKARLRVVLAVGDYGTQRDQGLFRRQERSQMS